MRAILVLAVLLTGVKGALSESSVQVHGTAASAQAIDPSPRSIEELCAALIDSAQDNDLPVAFFANLIWQESRLRDDAVSRVGARGIAQFMPGTAVAVGLADPFDPREAIPASAHLLHDLRTQFGNLGLAAAAYNAGAGRVSEWLDHRRALPRETQLYVARVTSRAVEDWRTPPPDLQLAFAESLPCRGLPAFADLEQAQFPEAEQLHAAHARQEQAVREVMQTFSAIYRRVAAHQRAGGARHDPVRFVARGRRRGGHLAARLLHRQHPRRRTASGEGRRYNWRSGAAAIGGRTSA